MYQKYIFTPYPQSPTRTYGLVFRLHLYWTLNAGGKKTRDEIQCKRKSNKDQIYRKKNTTARTAFDNITIYFRQKDVYKY